MQGPLVKRVAYAPEFRGRRGRKPLYPVFAPSPMKIWKKRRKEGKARRRGAG